MPPQDQSQQALDLLDEVAEALHLLAQRGHDLEAAIGDAKLRADAELRASVHSARHWRASAMQLRARIGELEQSMADRGPRAGEAEAAQPTLAAYQDWQAEPEPEPSAQPQAQAAVTRRDNGSEVQSLPLLLRLLTGSRRSGPALATAAAAE